MKYGVALFYMHIYVVKMWFSNFGTCMLFIELFIQSVLCSLLPTFWLVAFVDEWDNNMFNTLEKMDENQRDKSEESLVN